MGFMLDGWEVCSYRVEEHVPDHLRDCAPYPEKYKVVQKNFPCRKIEIGRIAIFFSNFIPQIESEVNFWSQKLAWTHFQYLESIKTAHFEMNSSSL